MSENRYHSSSHAKFLLRVHLVLVCKYRKKLLYRQYNKDMLQFIRDIEDESDFTIEVMQSDLDHLHLLVDYPPTLSVVSIVRRLKSMSTVRIWAKHERFLLNHFWKERTFWSDGYFACSVGDASADTIRRYIEQQG